MTATPRDEALRAKFEAQFHSRTLAYHPAFADDGRAVVIRFGESAHTAAGHALAHTLINLLARAHRRIVIVGDLDRPLLCASMFAPRTLHQATVGLARSINPYIEIDTGDPPSAGDTLVSFGIGNAGAQYDLGANRWVAHVGEGTITDSPTSIVGASLAACFGSYIAFNARIGRGPIDKGSFSAWDYLTTPDAQGPELEGRLDVGRVLCVGAGAVASALAFFATLRGVKRQWVVVDGDLVDVTNLNRQMAFIAADAGWPNSSPANKAEALATRLGTGAIPSPHWYNDDPSIRNDRYDVVLALANERGVRAALAQEQPTVLLHATTSPNWQAQLHRNVAGHDDCLTCRLPGDPPLLICSTAEIQTNGTSADAALPFMSATAGLMLLVALTRLQTGHLLDHPYNYFAIDFGGPSPHIQRHIETCRTSCRTRLDRPTRQRVDAASRWVQLDRLET